MSKLFYTSDICEMVDEKLDRRAKEIVMNSRLVGDELLEAVGDYRTLQANLYSLINDLKAADEAYDAETAAWKAKREAENNV